jgi:predicted RNA-binding protein with RPS1 domain
MRTAECKDCRREVAAGLREEGAQFFSYPEAWADGQLERGGSRSDRCREHRLKHQQHIAGVAVAYIDLATVGEVADRNDPTGPLGGLGPLPEAHRVADTPPVDLGAFGFGMDETHIRAMLESLSDPERRVLVVKAGTGTGKSTYMPYRLLDPPDGAFRLTDLGPIVVTEPRVQATVGVAEFVGMAMSGAGGVGPGYPVGFQVSGNRSHDSACQLVYVTDGTMINWLREGRLSQIGTVIVDEAHERSTNIDFILGYLKRALPRYPHLRVIITSATFDADFYQQFFGGPSIAGKIDVPAVKSIGYGWPLFPELDLLEGDEGVADRWSKMAPELALSGDIDQDRLVRQSWPPTAPPLKKGDVTDLSDVGYVEDLHATTRKLLPLRFQTPLPTGRWKDDMPAVLGNYIVKLAKGLDRQNIFGDILGFLPTGKNIAEACDIVRAGLGDRADVFALLSSLPTEDKIEALSARRMGDKRKVVISTNLAETSLTVEGVRFVVDSGLIAQSEWNPEAAQGGIRTKAHSQAGIKQRWGRVGRKAPGWVFPLYTKAQLLELSEDTAPGSTRDNLEQLVMTAKLGGIDNVVDFDWPAAFLPVPPVVLDATALQAREVFLHELVRANEALRSGGALDQDGDPTSFGKELTRFQALGSTSCAIAIMYADRLACVPEVVTILALLNETQLAGQKALLLDRLDWPDEWRLEAYERHHALATACEDDAELVLQIAAAWERADQDLAPWEPSELRKTWAREWWINHDLLLAAAEQRRDILAALSPAMKEEVKRFIEPALLRRSRGAVTRAFAGLEYEDRDRKGFYYPSGPAQSESGEEVEAAHPGAGQLTALPQHVIPLSRRRFMDVQFLSNLVTAEVWALPSESDFAQTGHADVVRLLELSARYGQADESKDVLGATITSWPAGRRVKVRFARDGHLAVSAVEATISPAPLPDDGGEAETAIDSEGLVSAELLQSDSAADETATIADASPELDTSWPTAKPAEADAAELLRRAVLDHREVEAAELACNACDACNDGRPQECLNPLTRRHAATVDVLSAWRARATTGIDVSMPLVSLDDGLIAEDGAWYEVIGYEIASNGTPVVQLTRDWRPEDHPYGPGEHPDLEPGQHLQVLVGSRRRDHGGNLLVLSRADGKGRFVLREAHTAPDKQEQNAQLALSLSRQYVGLLERLAADATLMVTVVPRAIPRHYTVTLLEVLHQHLTAISNESAQRFEIVTANGSFQLPFYPAVVTGVPNLSGYQPVELLTRDELQGLTHGASFFVGPEGERDSAPFVGSPLFLRLNRDAAKLSLSGRPLEEFRKVASKHSTVVVKHEDEDSGLDEAPTETEGFESGGGADTTIETGTYTTLLMSRGAVSRAAVKDLLAIDDSIEWLRDVWLFWARSRHLRTDRNDPHRPGFGTDYVHRPAALAGELPPPPDLTVDQTLELYPRGSVHPAHVTRVSDELGRAWLTMPDGTQASVGAREVETGSGVLSAALKEGNVVDARVVDVREHRGAAQVTLSLRTEATPPQNQPPPLAVIEATYPRGTVVNAVVDQVRDDLGRAWLRLPDGVRATVTSSDVGSVGVLRIGSALMIDQAVTGRVRSVSERNGVAQVQVELKQLPTPSMFDQLADVGIETGVLVDGRVASVVDALGVFVEVHPGVNGLIHRSQVNKPLTSFEKGDPCAVRVVAVVEDRKKPGRPNVQLTQA